VSMKCDETERLKMGVRCNGEKEGHIQASLVVT
jgi:hypothetical protein